MRSVTVDKAKLLEKLHTNRDAHHDIFLEAVEGFRAEAVRRLEEEVDRIRDGRLAMVQVVIPAPQDHTRDYDSLIGVLEMTDQTEIEVTEAEYRQYVMDDWGWKESFLSANSTYSQTAARQLSRY